MKALVAAKTAGSVYAARIRQLEYEELVRKLVRADDVEEAARRRAEIIGAEIDRLHTYAEDLATAYSRKGIVALRVALKSVSRSMREAIAANFKQLSEGAPGTE